MATTPGPQRLKDLCEALDLLAINLTGPRQVEILGRIRQLVRAGDSPDQALADLADLDGVPYTREDGDPLTHLLRRHGVPHGTVTRDPYRPPIGLGGGHTVRQVFGCPGGRCARQWVRTPGVPVPVCAVDGWRLAERPSA